MGENGALQYARFSKWPSPSEICLFDRRRDPYFEGLGMYGVQSIVIGSRSLLLHICFFLLLLIYLT